MYTIDTQDDGVRHIDLKPEAAEKLVKYLTEEHEQALSDRRGLEDKWKDWLDQANSRRTPKGSRSRDSKIDMPLTRKLLLQNSARLINPIFQQDQLMVARPRSPLYHDFAMEVEKLLDYISDKVDLESICEDWVEQFQVFNLGVVKTPFIKTIKHVKQWTKIEFEMYAQLSAAGRKDILRRELSDGSVAYFIEEDKRVVVDSGAVPEVIPVEDFLCPITTQSVESAEWVSHRLWLTRAVVQARVNEGVYVKKDVNKKPIMDVLGKPSASRKKLVDHGMTEEKPGEQAPSSKQYEVLETYLSYDYDGKGKPHEIIVTWDRASGAILRCVDNPYHNFCRPFVTHCFKNVQGSIFGAPATYMLEPLHVAHAACVRQRLDAASLANEVLLLIQAGGGGQLKSAYDRDGLRGGLYEVDVDPKEIVQFSLSQPFTQLPELEAKFERDAQDLMSMSSYSYGREQIDRPTATGQVAIIEESKQPQFSQLERFRKSFATVIMHMLARYRQYFPEGMAYYVETLGEQERAALETALLSWPDVAIEEAVVVETKVTSAQMSKQLRKQEIVALLDRIPQLYQMLNEMAQQAMNPQNPGAMISAKLLNGMQAVVDQFLTEFEVPKKDELNPDLVQEAQVAQMVIQQVQQLQMQLQQQGQQMAQMAQQLQFAQSAQLPGGQGFGPPMGQPPGPPPGVQGPPGMGGQRAGQAF